MWKTGRDLGGGGGGGGRVDYSGLYGEAPPKRGANCPLFRQEVNKRVGISLAEEKRRVGKTDLRVFKRERIEMHCVYCGYVKGRPFAMEGTRYMYMKE